MESLNESSWDVVIAGTGFQESLLALALSRSGKKILHVDKNKYYGGPDATFSLDDAQDWSQNLSQHHVTKYLRKSFSNSSTETNASAAGSSSGLSFSRAYSLTLSPQIIYNQSFLLPALVSSKVDSQLEFLAVGSWWVYSSVGGDEGKSGTFLRVPNGREDLFADQSIDAKSKRGLIKFLRFLGHFEEDTSTWESHREQSLCEFLSTQFNIPTAVQQPLLALTFSPFGPLKTTVEFSLPRIARHLRSIGLFGPGFGAVFPKWGGLSEIAQVCCRAGAVGGGTYALGNGIQKIVASSSTSQSDSLDSSRLTVQLSKDDSIECQFIAGSVENIPIPTATDEHASVMENDNEILVTRSITIVSSQLISLFPPPSEGAPRPACSVLTFPSTALPRLDDSEQPPVYVIVHTSDSGECPTGQCVLYSSVALPIANGRKVLQHVIKILLETVEDAAPEVLWALHYEQKFPKTTGKDMPVSLLNGRVLAFSPQPFDLAFDDLVIEQVRNVWRSVVGESDSESFLVFPERNPVDAEESSN